MIAIKEPIKTAGTPTIVSMINQIRTRRRGCGEDVFGGGGKLLMNWVTISWPADTTRSCPTTSDQD
jgi:hypothetical protein